MKNEYMKNLVIKIIFKTVDGIIGVGDLKESTKEVFKVENVELKNIGSELFIPNIKEPNKKNIGLINIYKSKVIWYQEIYPEWKDEEEEI
ncbi:hypothetical protein [Clostridium beijerinckii]|uniref:Uncharacterized protein n=1 Tax=Clostridium beijerinckii TaxID=1520 RepID=A0AAX0B023_CLOBE|nr:hypothetical protein [Clostridium beijerinckii]NRT88558.1 hypothetical protein [Clostridium beijerinckii]NYC74013.1 hypothetical protein [Clostridium beijerinckii]